MKTRAEFLQKAAKREPSWDDLRAQRVFARLSLQLDQAEPKAHALRGRAVRWGALAFALPAAAALLVLVLQHRARRFAASADANGTGALAAAPVHLVDGSDLLVEPKAQMDVVEEKSERVRIVQRGGKIDYHVAHNPARAFIIDAGEVRVTVRGTKFSVEMVDDAVEVRVASGKVQVDDGLRPTELLAGESVRLRAFSARKRASEADTARQDPSQQDPGQQGEVRDEDLLVDPSRAPATIANAGVHPHPSGAQHSEHAEHAEPLGDQVDPVDALFRDVTALRARGDLADAAAKLRQLVHEHPRDPRVASAEFTLGRVERARGHHAEAAMAFGHCASFAPRGTLAEEALSEEASSWLAAGNREQAVATAGRSLALFPHGTHADRMRSIQE